MATKLELRLAKQAKEAVQKNDILEIDSVMDEISDVIDGWVQNEEKNSEKIDRLQPLYEALETISDGLSSLDTALEVYEE